MCLDHIGYSQLSFSVSESSVQIELNSIHEKTKQILNHFSIAQLSVITSDSTVISFRFFFKYFN